MEKELSYKAGRPYHLSVGALVVNDESKICVHHYSRIQELTDIYLLMRETISTEETLEKAIERGLLEEFGMTAQITDYLGCWTCSLFVQDEQRQVEKTTIYFLCQYHSHNLSKRSTEDDEMGSQIEWHTPEHLIEIMSEQGKRTGRADADESEIIKRYLERKHG